MAKSLPVAFGVTSGVKGRAKTPIYFTTEISEDGIVTVHETEFRSWNAATIASKALASKIDAEYWIADQVKAFQKRLVRESE